MKRVYVILLTLLWIGCNDGTKEQVSNSDSVANIPPVRMGNFYATDSTDLSKSVVIADTIVYDVILRNPDAEDDWAAYCLRRMDINALSNIVFNAIYNKRLIPHDYRTDEVLSVEAVKAFEKEYKRNRIGKMQFIEEWYFNENSLQFNKNVTGIMLAYELYNDANEVKGYKAGIKVYLNEKK